MSDKEDEGLVSSAWKMYSHVFQTLKNAKSHASNKHHVGHPARVEHDLDELEKAHLDLLKTKIEIEIAKEAKETNESLSNRVFWLNLALVLLSCVMALAAILELFQ